jgi:hypothetical protein
MDLPNGLEFLEAVNGKGWSQKPEVELGGLLAGSASVSYAKLL